MTPLTEHSPIPVELTIGEWNAVLNQLMDGPHRAVAPLITKIGNAVKQYADAYNAQLAPPATNGADHASSAS